MTTEGERFRRARGATIPAKRADKLTPRPRDTRVSVLSFRSYWARSMPLIYLLDRRSGNRELQTFPELVHTHRAHRDNATSSDGRQRQPANIVNFFLKLGPNNTGLEAVLLFRL